MEDNIRKSKEKLDSIYKKSNKIDIAIERLVRYHIYRHFSIMGIYASPVSSDLSLIGDLCILNIDSKTVDIKKNPSDVKPGIIEYNQVTFEDNLIMKGVSKEGIDFSGFSFQGRLHDFEKNKPFICYFLKVIYDNNGTNGFEIIDDIQLYCIPHKSIVTEKYKEGLISGIKTYDYMTDPQEIEVYGNNYAVKENINPKWIEVTPPNGKTLRWIDSSLNCPINPNKKTIWGKKDKNTKYYVIKGGQTFRIPRKRLENRLDGMGYEW